MMIIGVPKEIKAGETRVAVIPENVSKIVQAGHKVLIERSAGVASGFDDGSYRDAGAEIVDNVEEVWERAEMIVKIKEPQKSEVPYFKENLVIFGYLHLESREWLVRALCGSKVVGIAMEKVETDDGVHVLYPPMSEITGRIAVIKGANLLLRTSGGSGVLLGRVPELPPAKVMIIGGGSVGSSAAVTAAALGAEVVVLDINPNKVRMLNNLLPSNVRALMCTRENVEREIGDTDLLIGAVLISRPNDPHIVTEEMVKRMKPGSVIVDVTVGFGGYIETATRGTTPDDPVYTVHDVIHYCVPNIPSEVPNTASKAFSNATLPYVLELAEKGYKKALLDNSALRRGLNTVDGKVTYKLIADTFGMEYHDAKAVVESIK